jgi:DNA-binding ferritin-like protein
MTGSIRSCQKENYKQLKHLVEKIIRESDDQVDKIKERFLKLNQDHSNAENERPPTFQRSAEQIKACFKENNRILTKMVKDESMPILFNDSVFKVLLTDACKFYQKAMHHLDQVVAHCYED